MPDIDERPIATATDVAKYFVALVLEDGDLITNLKVQKLVYYAYAHVLAQHRRKLFTEPIQAWANGPVVYGLWSYLRRYGRGPIGEDFLGSYTDGGFEAFAAVFPSDVLETLNGVYEQYAHKSAFELVTLTHGERPWREAREGLQAHEIGSEQISDEAVMRQFAAV